MQGLYTPPVGRLCLYSLLTGLFLGALYELFRIRRLSVGENLPGKHRLSRLLSGAEDFLFCLLASLSLILLYAGVSRGIIRGYSLFCLASGFLVLRLLFRRLNERLIAPLVRKTVLALTHFFSVLLCFLCRMTVLPLLRILRFFLQKAKRALWQKKAAAYTRRQTGRFFRSASSDFLS